MMTNRLLRVAAGARFCATLIFVFSFFGFTTKFPQVSAASNPIVAYSFDEGSGTTAADTSGNNNNAALVNGPIWTAGHSGLALNFDGIADYVNAGNIAALNGLTAVTVSAWVKGSVDALSPDAVIVGKDQAFAMVVVADTAMFALKSGDSWYSSPFSITSVDDGKFHFLTGVYDGTTLRIYVDGVQEGSHNIGGLTLNASLTNLEVASCAGGPDCDPSGEMWSGVIDDVRVYNRALSQGEIQADMITPVGGTPVPDTTGPAVAITSIIEANVYTTNFPSTENPISESGKWVNGHTNGLDWTDVQTTPGLAFGTQDGTGDCNPPTVTGCNDSTAILTGSWGANYQYTRAVVHSTNPVDNPKYEEVELRLRSAVSVHSITGYEITWRVGQFADSYAGIVRWNGALGDFTLLVTGLIGPQYGVTEGDVVEAYMIGTVITAKKNGVVQFTYDVANDSTKFLTGNPGMGFYNQLGGSGANADHGFTSYTASNNPIDTTSPAVANTIVVAGTASDSGLGNSGISSVTVNGVAASGGTASGSGTANWSQSVALNAGANTITVVAKDASANQNSTTVAITINFVPADTTAPSINISTPTAAPTYTTSTDPLTLTGSASDNIGVTQVVWSNDRGGSGVATGTASWSVIGILLQPGTNVLTVTAADAANNVGTATLTVTYTASTDTTGPAVAITSHTNNQTVTSSPITVVGTASDSGLGNSGISSVTVNGIGASGGSATGSATANWSQSVALNAGANTITVVAKDASTNQNSSTVAITVNYNVTQPTGLVAGYAFNETSGSTTADASGNGNTGILTNGAVFVAGKNGNAVRLDGVNDHVNLGNPASLQLIGSMTISAWINAASFPFDDAAVVSSMASNETSGFQLDTTVDTGPRRIGFKLVSSTGGFIGRYGATALQLSQWYHIAGVYAAASQTVVVYLNGQLDNGTLVGTVGAAQRNSSLAVNIGQRPAWPGTYNFAGRIDDVRIYNRALTQAEIQADMNTPVGGNPPPTDTTPPSISLTAPANGTTVSGTTTVSANASDNSGLVSVQFLLDGIGLGAERTGPLFSFFWDTTRVPNGQHTLSAQARDAAGNVASAGNVTVTVNNALANLAPTYPVKAGPTGRYLVDQNNVPFLIAGDSPQAMIGNLSEADAELFFQNRKAHGFNTVWINLLCAGGFFTCRYDGSTFDGIVPFTAVLDNSGTPNAPKYDLTTPNEAYFARAERILQIAAQYGFLVILDPIETIGWLDVLRANGVTRNRTFGQYLGQRFAGLDNIVWMHGNDYNIDQPPNAEDDAYTTAVALGIRDIDVDSSQLQTLELFYYSSSSLDDPTWASLIQLNAAYTYFPTYQEILKGYNRPDFLPTFLIEASYEFEHFPNTELGTPQVLRRQIYWTNLSGATGHVYGNHYTWSFDDGWKSQLDTPGAAQMAYVKALFEPRAWYNLVPDQTHTVVTDGFGTFGSTDYVTAARTPDGKLVIAYVPSTSIVTVDMSQLSGPVTASWYDPSAGTFTQIAGSPIQNTGLADFMTPGANGDGGADWVLVLETL